MLTATSFKPRIKIKWLWYSERIFPKLTPQKTVIFNQKIGVIFVFFEKQIDCANFHLMPL